jgi:acyl dehydratase
MTSAIGDPPVPYRVRARNTSTASENRIHHDDVAAAYGFRGGLVRGVAVYAYMTRPAVDAFGHDWVERGTMAARFVQPFYAGDEVVVRPTVAAANALELVASRDDGGEVCATGRAAVPATGQAPVVPAAGDYAVLPTPRRGERPPATAAVFRRLPGLCLPAMPFDASKAGAYLDQIGEDHPLFREGGIAHPGWLVRFANTVLSANVTLGPWIHTSTESTHLRAVVDGEEIATRARVAEVFERKGHQMVSLDVLLLANGKPAMHALHTAIFEIAKRQ